MSTLLTLLFRATTRSSLILSPAFASAAPTPHPHSSPPFSDITSYCDGHDHGPAPDNVSHQASHSNASAASTQHALPSTLRCQIFQGQCKKCASPLN
ncbi:hypothetical protein E2C01_084916 [Portunus trituberculatus]|uniref:Uncharacterized protein n=1 Tax=Portunus trituberculatus TaxID=210409 RepID=A0A5B7J182_PORTR|nr:hypothetical protein [Portunus trituberculatus]